MATSVYRALPFRHDRRPIVAVCGGRVGLESFNLFFKLFDDRFGRQIGVLAKRFRHALFAERLAVRAFRIRIPVRADGEHVSFEELQRFLFEEEVRENADGRIDRGKLRNRSLANEQPGIVPGVDIGQYAGLRVEYAVEQGDEFFGIRILPDSPVHFAQHILHGEDILGLHPQRGPDSGHEEGRRNAFPGNVPFDDAEIPAGKFNEVEEVPADFIARVTGACDVERRNGGGGFRHELALNPGGDFQFVLNLSQGELLLVEPGQRDGDGRLVGHGAEEASFVRCKIVRSGDKHREGADRLAVLYERSGQEGMEAFACRFAHIVRPRVRCNVQYRNGFVVSCGELPEDAAGRCERVCVQVLFAEAGGSLERHLARIFVEQPDGAGPRMHRFGRDAHDLVEQQRQVEMGFRKEPACKVKRRELLFGSVQCSHGARNAVWSKKRILHPFRPMVLPDHPARLGSAIEYSDRNCFAQRFAFARHMDTLTKAASLSAPLASF